MIYLIIRGIKSGRCSDNIASLSESTLNITNSDLNDFSLINL